MTSKKNYLRHLLYVIILVTIDQLSKYFVKTELINGKEIIIWDGVFKLISHRNTGAVWGLFSDATLVITILSIIILIAVLFFYTKIPKDRSRLYPLQLICVFVASGAIGNLIDRISMGEVVDFLYFELINFPVFNLADCYITLSEILLIILIVFYYKETDFNFIKIFGRNGTDEGADRKDNG